MKKYIFFISLIMMSVACQKQLMDNEQTQDDICPENIPELIPETRTITSEQAIEFGNMAFSAISASESVPFSAIEAKREAKEAVPILDDNGNAVMFLLNAVSDNGYLLISADKEASRRILAFSEIGNLDIDSIDPQSPFGSMLSEQKAKISSEIAQGINMGNDGYDLWEAIGKDDFSVEIKLCNEAPETKGLHRNRKDYKDISPKMAVYTFKWGQGTGYNADAPIPNYYPAGCSAVAIGILCMANLYPSQFRYAAMPITLNTTSSNPISRMFRSIADAIPNYDWKSSGSGATPSEVLIGLRNLGYTQAEYSNYSLDLAYESFRKGYPVLLGGNNFYTIGRYTFDKGAHIWIASGYWQATWQITQRFLWFRRTWYEYQDNIYMNWGMDGDGNGWIDSESWPNYNDNRKMYHKLYPSYY